MLLTRRKRKREEMLKDECDIMRKQHEEENENFVEEIRKLKEQSFDLDEVRREEKMTT